MNNLISSVSDISPIMAILWCFYPFAILVILELILDKVDDDNDDQGGGKLIPVYARSN